MALESGELNNKDTFAETKRIEATAAPLGYNGYRFVSDIVNSLTSLIVGLAWPLMVLIILGYIAHHGSGFASDTKSLIQAIMAGNQKVDVQANSSGIHLIVVAQAVQQGLTQQVTTAAGGNAPQGAEVTGIQEVAEQAVSQLSSRIVGQTL